MVQRELHLEGLAALCISFGFTGSRICWNILLCLYRSGHLAPRWPRASARYYRWNQATGEAAWNVVRGRDGKLWESYCQPPQPTLCSINGGGNIFQMIVRSVSNIFFSGICSSMSEARFLTLHVGIFGGAKRCRRPFNPSSTQRAAGLRC